MDYVTACLVLWFTALLQELIIAQIVKTCPTSYKTLSIQEYCFILSPFLTSSVKNKHTFAIDKCHGSQRTHLE